jgi:hypothetical protein
MYYRPICFISSFNFSPFLMVVSTSLKILYSFWYRECIKHIPLSFLLVYSLAPVWCITFHYCYTCVRSIFHIWEKTWGFSASEPGYLHLPWCSPAGRRRLRPVSSQEAESRRIKVQSTPGEIVPVSKNPSQKMVLEWLKV